MEWLIRKTVLKIFRGKSENRATLNNIFMGNAKEKKLRDSGIKAVQIQAFPIGNSWRACSLCWSILMEPHGTC